jgi:DnaJ-class molecular chaperone
MSIKLEEGEVICSRCNGEGFTAFVDIQQAQVTCPKCNGAGKLDWISNAMGERPKSIPPNGNICIGYKAGYNITTGCNNICIGHKAGYNLTTENDKVCIGDEP